MAISKNSAKSPKHAPKNPAAPAARQASSGRFPHWAILALCLLGTGGGSWAFFEYVVWNVLPPQLVGKWVVTKGQQEGATFDFYRSGKMVGKVNQGGMLGIINATVRVEGDKIYSTTLHPQTGQASTSVLIIRTLTARDLVVEDQKGERITMERAD